MVEDPLATGGSPTAKSEAAAAAAVPDDGPSPEGAPDRAHHASRLLEALLFAAVEPLGELTLSARIEAGLKETRHLLRDLQCRYEGRGIQLVCRDGRWAFRTAPDLAPHFRTEEETRRKLSKAALETLAIIAYHQPVTRAEIESIRGVAVSRGTLDLLLETGWIKPGKRREVPGRPLTWLTTPTFLDQFSLPSLQDLPGVDDLRAAGLLDARPVLTAIPGRRGEADGADADDGTDGDDADD